MKIRITIDRTIISHSRQVHVVEVTSEEGVKALSTEAGLSAWAEATAPVLIASSKEQFFYTEPPSVKDVISTQVLGS